MMALLFLLHSDATVKQLYLWCVLLQVVALAYERRTWHASNGEEIGAVGSSNRGIKWRYSVISPGDFIEPQVDFVACFRRYVPIICLT